MAPNDRILSSLEGSPCNYCEEGILIREQFKGNSAVLCSQCGTPAIQSWEPE
ncbi:HVO_A0556 family zinc finger protein [Halopiger aswanensis]|uniref:Small CPxCG-related zinc finger protein n=1 Tax=Halopiger aswanensis TaxID=148449 RepID=A0A419WRG0_9EURY|nr:hypothetical protein ATJ93_1083 [Halopiger aswanensis]